MKSFKESVLLNEAKSKGKVIVVYGGGFQPFHAGHLSSYTQAKAKFHTPDFYVASSNDTKVRPIPFKDKEFLAQQAGVTDDFVQVVQPINPEEIMKKYDEKKDILILVRSERDPMKYTKKDGSPAYYQPFVSIDKCESFETHAYIFVTKKHDFTVNGKEAFSGSQVRKMYSDADSEERDKIISDLYPKAKNKAKVKKLLDKYIGGGMNEELEQQDEAVLGYAQRRHRAQQFKRMAKRLLRARQLQSKRAPDNKRVQQGAKKLAYKFFRQRYASGGKSYADLSTGEKISIDTRLQKMLPSIRKLAARLIPLARKKALDRRTQAMQASKLGQVKKEDVNRMFGTFVEAVKTPEARKESSRLDQLVRLGLADTKSLSTIKRSVDKLKSGDVLSPQERTATNDLLTTLLDMVTSSDALFRMTKTQLQKESIDDKFKKYIIPATKTTPKIEKISMPAGRTTDHVEYKVTGSLASQTRTFKSKKEADAYFNTVKESYLNNDEYDNYEDDDSAEMDGISMAQIQLSNICDDAEDLIQQLDAMDEEPDEWVLSKITKAEDYIATVRDYLEFDDNFEDDGEDDDGEYGNEVDAYINDMEPADFGDAYEEFKPIIEEIKSLYNKSEKSGISYDVLKEVYRRGLASTKKGTMTQEQWAFARVNSFITRRGSSWLNEDKDLAEKVTLNKMFEALEWGTDAMRKSYAADTPGQSTDIQNADHCCDDCNEVDEGLKDPKDNPCWKGYKPVGTKVKNGKTVPNCVPVEEDIAEEVDWENILVEADYQGKSVKLNDPFRTPDGPKKFGVYTMGPNGNVVVVRFGDPNMEIKRDDPERRASYRARHGCDNPGPKWKANYWSCYQWRAGAKVDS
jgi:hypothetical protein